MTKNEENFIKKINELEEQLRTLKYNYDAQEIIIKDKSAIMEAMAQPKTCSTCSKKLLCEMAQKSKDLFGTKLNEQWFICYEPKGEE